MDGIEMSEAQKKRMEEFSNNYAVENYGRDTVPDSLVARDVKAGYQEGLQDPSRFEALDSVLKINRAQVRVELFENILKNIREVGFEETLAWMNSRHSFESEILGELRKG